MNKLFTKYLRVCPKSGKLRGFSKLKGLSRLLFPVIGLAALIWILIRVIPKPSRINYPCIRTAMPIASGFIGYIFMLLLSAAAFIKSKKSFYYYPLFLLASLAVFGISGSSLIGFDEDWNAPKYPTINVEANQPIGEAKGIFPGRVVWVHNPDATNENCHPSNMGDGWFLSKNNNQTVIDEMVSSALRNLTGQTNDSSAWKAIFTFYNENKGKGEVSYSPDEKIFIKINATSAWSGNFKTSDLSKTYNGYYGTSETSPEVVLSVLRQLVNVVGVPQDRIYVGDPMKHIYKHSYDMWYNEFKDVHYLDNNYNTLGREIATPSTTAIIHYSDDGEVLRPEVWDPGRPGGTDPVLQDYLYSILEDADYMINIPMLKGHKRAGMTMFAKNHFGSQTHVNASHLHNGLVAPMEMENTSNPRSDYGLYRVQVDIMGHKLLGGKNLVYIMDALWATDYELDAPLKWHMPPFNNDWMSSVFASLDPVAIESVGYDFLRSEFTIERGAGTYVQMEGVDDYLHQAADSANWPEGVVYKPSGERIGSLGVHEHWNDAEHMQYTRNLGTGDGIELIKASPSVNVEEENNQLPGKFVLYQNYPNPFNPSTVISFDIAKDENVNLSVYDASGKLVKVLINNEFRRAGNYQVNFNAASMGNKSGISSGIYYYRLRSGNEAVTRKMMLIK